MGSPVEHGRCGTIPSSAVRIDDINVQGILDCPGQLGQREPLQQSQHPDVGPRAVAWVEHFEPPRYLLERILAMTQAELDRAVAEATGETVQTITNRGFSILTPMPTELG